MEPLATQTTSGLREQARLKPSRRGVKEKLDFCVVHQGFAPDCVPGEVYAWGYKKPKPKKYSICGRCRKQELNEVPPPALAATTGISLVENGFCWERVLFLTDKERKPELTIHIPQLVGILAHRAISEFGEHGSTNPRVRQGPHGVLGIVGSGILVPGTIGVAKSRLRLDSIEIARQIKNKVGQILETGIRSGLVKKRRELLDTGASWIGFEFNFRVDLATIVGYFERWDELRTKRELGLNLNLRGGIDRLVIGKDGTSDLVDFKTFHPGAGMFKFARTKQMSWYGTVHRWHRRDHTSRDEPLDAGMVKMEHRFITADKTATQATKFQGGDPRSILVEIYEFWRHFSRAQAAKLKIRSVEDQEAWQKEHFPPTSGAYCRNCPAFGKCSATFGEKVEDQVPISVIQEGLLGEDNLRLIT